MERNRILIIGARKSGKLTLVKQLTSSLPFIPDGCGHGGLSHELMIKNKYYSAQVGIWIDEFESAEQWVDEFSSEEAKEVRDVLGVVLYTFNPKEVALEHEFKQLARFIEVLDSENWDGVALAASKGKLEDSDLEDLLFEVGLEYVNLLSEESDGEKDGVGRVKDAIETFPWGGSGEETEFDGEANEEVLRDIMKSMSKPILEDDVVDDGDEKKVDDFEGFLQKLQNVRQNAKGISDEDRTKLSEDLADELLNML
jgi:hypothetical protein